jgi:hypothetical protein
MSAQQQSNDSDDSEAPHERQKEQNEQNDHVQPSPFRRYFWYFVLLSIALLSCVISWVLVSNFVDVSVPPQITLFTTAFLSGCIIYVLPSVVICSWLWNPFPYFVVDLDADTSYFALYKLSEKSFNELEFTDGEPFVLAPKVISVRNYDIEENTAEGTWRGSLDDIELARKLENVEMLKEDLENLAKRGLSYRSKYTKIIYDSVMRIHTAFLVDFETEVFKSGEVVQDSIRDSIDANLPDLEPASDDLDLREALEGLDVDRSIDFNDLSDDPFTPPSSNGDTDDELNPRSTRWSR